MVGTSVATVKANAVATASDNPWLQAAADANDFDGNFVKFNGNTGAYTSGQAQDEIPAGTRMAINMPGVKHGYICWKEGEVVDRAVTLVEMGPKPPISSLTDHGPYEKHEDGTEDGWSENHQVPMGDENGDKFMLQLSSESAVRSVKRFYTEYGKKRSQNIDDTGNYMVPIVELEVGSFISKANKRAGKKYFPVLNIVEWIPMAAVADLFDSNGDGGDAPEDYAETAQANAPAEKKKRTPRAAQPAPAPETEPVEEVEAEVETQPEVQPETPPPAVKKAGGFVKPKAEEAPEQTTKAAANAAAAAKVAEGGRRAKRF